jgi:hypothetical protein
VRQHKAIGICHRAITYFTAFCATAGQYFTAIGSLHALSKTMYRFTAAAMRLKCTFHDSISFFHFYYPPKPLAKAGPAGALAQAGQIWSGRSGPGFNSRQRAYHCPLFVKGRQRYTLSANWPRKNRETGDGGRETANVKRETSNGRICGIPTLSSFTSDVSRLPPPVSRRPSHAWRLLSHVPTFPNASIPPLPQKIRWHAGRNLRLNRWCKIFFYHFCCRPLLFPGAAQGNL